MVNIVCLDNKEYEIRDILLKEYQLKGCEQSFAMLTPKGERVIVGLSDLEYFYNKGYILNSEFGSQEAINTDEKVYTNSDFKPAAYALLTVGAIITVCIIALIIRLYRKLWIWLEVDVPVNPKPVKQTQKIPETQNREDRVESLSIDELNDFLSGNHLALTNWVGNGGEKPVKRDGGYV